MKVIIKFIQSYPAYLTSVLTSGFALFSLIAPSVLTPDQFKAAEAFALLVLLGWVHSSVTPNIKVKEEK